MSGEVQEGQPPAGLAIQAPEAAVSTPASPMEDRQVQGLAAHGDFRSAMDMMALNTPQKDDGFSLSGMVAEFKAMFSGKPKA